MIKKQRIFHHKELLSVPATAQKTEDGELKLIVEIPMDSDEDEIWALGSKALDEQLEQKLEELLDDRQADYALLTHELKEEKEDFGKEVYKFTGFFEFTLYKNPHPNEE